MQFNLLSSSVLPVSWSNPDQLGRNWDFRVDFRKARMQALTNYKSTVTWCRGKSGLLLTPLKIFLFTAQCGPEQNMLNSPIMTFLCIFTERPNCLLTVSSMLQRFSWCQICMWKPGCGCSEVQSFENGLDSVSKCLITWKQRWYRNFSKRKCIC